MSNPGFTMPDMSGNIRATGFMIVFAVALIGFIIWSSKQNKGSKKKDLSPATYAKLYVFMTNNFLTRTSARMVSQKIGTLSVFEPDEVRRLAVRSYFSSLGIAAGFVLATSLVFQDTYSTLVMLVYAVVLRECLVYKQLDNTEFEMLKQLRITISSVRQNYLRTRSVADAFGSAEVPPMLVKPIGEIYSILTAPNREQRLDAFYAATPYHILQTLAGEAYIFNESGDAKTPTGEYAFEVALSMCASDVAAEIRRINYQRSIFSIIGILPIAPIFMMGIIEMFFGKFIPGTSILYKGIYGYVARVLVVLVSCIGFFVITRINAAQTVKRDDRNVTLMKMLENFHFNKLVTQLMPKRLKRDRYYKNLRDAAISLKDTRLIFAGKVVATVCCFIVTLAAFVLTVNLSRDFAYHNVRSMSLMTTEDLTEELLSIRKTVDPLYLNLPVKPTLKQTQEVVRSRFPYKSELDIGDEAKRLMDKYDTYHSIEFKWWMMLMAFVAGFVGWKSQEIILIARRKMLESEAEQDLLQLQSVVCVIQYTSMDTLDLIYWLTKQSRVHKYALMACFHEYTSDPLMSLGRLKSKSSSPEFRMLADKLTSTVYDSSIPDAFGDLFAERVTISQVREVLQKAVIDKRRAFCSLLAMAPLAMVLILHFVVPIFILGWTQFSTALSGLFSN